MSGLLFKVRSCRPQLLGLFGGSNAELPMAEGRKADTTKQRKLSVTVGVRCPEPLLSMLDEYRRKEPDIPTRASALRRLAIMGLKRRNGR